MLSRREHFGGITMRTEFIGRTRVKLVALVAFAATVGVVPIAARAQMYSGNPSAAQQMGRATQASYRDSGGPAAGAQQADYADQYGPYGNSMVTPAGFYQQGGGSCGCDGGGCGCGDCYGGCNGGCGCGPGGCGCGPNGCGGGFNSCMPMGCGGTDPPIGYDLMNDAGMEGNPADQRGPHYFDIRAEAVYLHRDVTFEQDIQMTSLNVGNNVVLNTNQLDLDNQPGFRIIGRYDIAPLAVFEFGYTGILGWEDTASYTDPTNNLYSLWSRPAPEAGLFGTDPVGVNIVGGPNPESERAHKHSIRLRSDLQSAELSYRRYWLGYVPRISGTLLAGFRYTKLTDDFQFRTQGSEPATGAAPGSPLAALRYNEDCDNNLAGAQIGGDIWISMCQGLRLGSEAKGGLYNNHYKLTNRISTTPTGTTPPTLFEEFENNHAAFIGEGSVDLVADILPSVSLRVGYEVLFLNSLVLAGDNFNQTSPYGNQGTRVPFVDDDGQMFYHGAHAGLEYIW